MLPALVGVHVHARGGGLIPAVLVHVRASVASEDSMVA